MVQRRCDPHDVDPVIAAAVAAILGSEPRAWSPIVERGYAHNRRWIVRLSRGRTAFVKAAVDDRTARWLRTEHLVYSQLQAAFLPRMLGWQGGAGLPVLVLENLERWSWPPPWSRGRVSAVLEALGDLRRLTPPADLPLLESQRGA